LAREIDFGEPEYTRLGSPREFFVEGRMMFNLPPNFGLASFMYFRLGPRPPISVYLDVLNRFNRNASQEQLKKTIVVSMALRGVNIGMQNLPDGIGMPHS